MVANVIIAEFYNADEAHKKNNQGTSKANLPLNE
ncbi:hypothetical protein NSMM_280013 [Nitrosomonas mobilis]|uniref:Uncharacterized protein n=1 Tax=Nitrosomonas mobilis TaxID=51642 RepID=A0A1G5SCD2_9PROT|nr:hypothetical protein NSMM_280013 [Nitrosomonas mobilis]